MRTIIHVGHHKTATTSIQQFLLDNKQKLQDRKIYIPSYFLDRITCNHYEINVACLDHHRQSPVKDQVLGKFGSLDELKQRLSQEIARHYCEAALLGCDTILFSNEGLYLLKNPAEIARLKELFVRHSCWVSIILCIREAESHRKSWQAQLVKMGFQATSKENDDFRYTESDSWLFNYRERIQGFWQFFDAVSVFHYREEDNITPFLCLLGPDLQGLAADSYPRLNL